jgi:predicted acyltransferase
MANVNQLAVTEKPARLLSLDAFRGITILAMIMVNNPGTWSAMYWPLGHAQWHGWTPTDLIFPFFLFIVGTSLAYSLRKSIEMGGATPEVWARIVRRTCILFLLGVGMALFGHVCDYLSGKKDSLDLESLRYLGVLQRIALVYFFASLIVLKLSVRNQVMLSIVILLGYWAVLRWLPEPDNQASNLSAGGNIVRVVDLKVIGEGHLYKNELTEPEGLVSTPSSIVIALCGYWAGLYIQRSSSNAASRGVNPPGPTLQTVCLLIAAGAAAAAIGLAWGTVLPINKKIWTSSFCLLTSGLATMGLGACLAIFDVAGFKRLGRPFEIVGVNAITVYVGAGLLARVLGATHIGELTTHQWIYQRLFTDHIADPKLASLGFALLVVAFWWLVACAMSRRGWTLRV